MATSDEIGVWPAAGTVPAGRAGRVIELIRDDGWEPREPEPATGRARLAMAAAATLFVVTLAYIAGIARPTSLAPTFLRPGSARMLALDDARAYVSGDGTVTAHRLSDGDPLWTRRVVGLSGMLAVDGRLVLSTADGARRPTVQVLDGATGTVAWQRDTRLMATAGPAPTTTPDYPPEPTDTEPTRTEPADTEPTNTEPTNTEPATANAGAAAGNPGDTVLVVNGPADGSTVPLRGLSLSDGRPLWTVRMEPWAIVAQATSRAAQVEVVSDRLRIRDLTTGRAPVDVALPPGTTPAHAALVGGTALVVDPTGTIHAFDAGDGRLRWRQPSAATGLFSTFTPCGRYVCHVNDRGTFALDRTTGHTAWRSATRYTVATVDDDHMFVAQTFEGLDGQGTAVADPRTGMVRTGLAPWRALGVVTGSELLVWRPEGRQRELLGFFDARTSRTRVVGRTDAWSSPPTCAVGPAHVLCANAYDFAAWPR